MTTPDKLPILPEDEDLQKHYVLDPKTKATNIDNVVKLVADTGRKLVADITDMSDEENRKAVRRAARKVSSSKVALDNAGEEMKADWQKKVTFVDRERRRMRDALDAVRDEILKPADDWEVSEKKRIDDITDAITDLADVSVTATTSLEAKKERLTYLQSVTVEEDAYQEFTDQAKVTLANAIEAVQSAIVEQEKKEAEEKAQQEELERLRKIEEEAKAKEAAQAARIAELEAEKEEREREDPEPVEQPSEASAEAEGPPAEEISPEPTPYDDIAKAIRGKPLKDIIGMMISNNIPHVTFSPGANT